MNAIEKRGAGEPARRGWSDGVLPWLAVPAIGTVAVVLWISNGPRVFAEMLSAAWSLCF